MQPHTPSVPSACSQVSVNPAGAGNKAFNTLARYIFGDNQARAKMAMTTPVFSDTAGSMRFVIGQTTLKVRAGCRTGVCLAGSPFHTELVT